MTQQQQTSFNIVYTCLFRSWYDRNKHIFPASRWEPFDPTKDYSRREEAEKLEFKRGNEGEDKNILSKLARGQGPSDVKGQCTCSKSQVCEMHWTANRWGGVGGGGGWG